MAAKTRRQQLRRLLLRRRLFVIQGLSFLTLGLFFTLGQFAVTARIAVLLIVVATFGLGITMGGTANSVFYRWATGRAITEYMNRHFDDYPDCPGAAGTDADVIPLDSWSGVA